MNWYAELSHFEPPYKTPNWGEQCIEFRCEDKGATEMTPYPWFHTDAVEKAEKTGKVLRLFPTDISYREAYAALH